MNNKCDACEYPLNKTSNYWSLGEKNFCSKACLQDFIWNQLELKGIVYGTPMMVEHQINLPFCFKAMENDDVIRAYYPILKESYVDDSKKDFQLSDKPFIRIEGRDYDDVIDVIAAGNFWDIQFDDFTTHNGISDLMNSKKFKEKYQGHTNLINIKFIKTDLLEHKITIKTKLTE